MTDSLSVADVMALQNRDGAGDFGFGGNGAWVFFLFFLLAWGNGGLGGFNGGRGISPEMQGIATRADINSGFALNGIERNIQGIQQGICDSTYALNNSINNGFRGMESILCNGFNSVNGNISNLGYELQSCCCQTQRAIDGVRYDTATQSCAVQNSIKDLGYNMATMGNSIIQSSHNDTDRVLAKLSEMEANRLQDKLNSVTAENQALKFQASQSAQNAFIAANQEAQTAQLIRRIAPVPIPAYQVPNPNCGCGYGCNNCGC